jgi:hypothetical protein
VPLGVRKLIGCFPSNHWEMLSGIAMNPAVQDLLESNPALGWMSQVFWKFIPGAKPDVGRAAALAELSQREIVATLGFPDAAWAVRVIRKMPAECLSVRELCTIRDLARDPDDENS